MISSVNSHIPISFKALIKILASQSSRDSQIKIHPLEKNIGSFWLSIDVPANEGWCVYDSKEQKIVFMSSRWEKLIKDVASNSLVKKETEDKIALQI